MLGGWAVLCVVTISLDNDVLAGDSSSHQLPGARGAAVVCGDNGAVIRPRSILIKWAGWHQAWRGTAEIIPGITLRIATLVLDTDIQL